MDNLRLARDVQIAQQRRQSEISNKGDFQARPFILDGSFLMVGTGELVKDISFPVMFTEKPLLTVAGDMADNEVIVAGKYPTVSGVVLKYVTKKPNTQSLWYTGASIIVVTTGIQTQQMWIHWSFTGSALVNPIQATSTTDDAI